MIVSSFEIAETVWIKMFKSPESVNAGEQGKPKVLVIHTTARTDTTAIPQILLFHLNVHSVHQKTTAQHVSELLQLTVSLVRPTWNVPMRTHSQLTELLDQTRVCVRLTSRMLMEHAQPASL